MNPMKPPENRPLPDRDDCLAIMARYGMPPHIVRHSVVVCTLAVHLANRLISYGYDVDVDLVRGAALLHDLTKTHSLSRPLDHALTGAKVLKNLGYPGIAAIVRQHVRLSKSRPPGRLAEPELVNYADKRVVNDQVATLEERLDYIRRRYGRTPESLSRIEKFAAMAVQIEREIFSVISGGPGQLFEIDVERELSAL